MADPTFVVKERLRNFTVHPADPQSMSLRVSPGVIIVNDGDPTTGIIDTSNYGSIRVETIFNTVGPLVAPAVAGDYRYDLICIDNLSNFHAISGPEVNHVPTLTGEAPVIPGNMIPLAMILLNHATTYLDPSNIIDIRPHLTTHQDRTRTHYVESVNPGAIAPVSSTVGNFDRVNWVHTTNNPSIRWDWVVPEDFDYNRDVNLHIRGYSAVAAAATFTFRLVIERVAATGGVFPPVAAPANIDYDFAASGSGTNIELWTMPIVGAIGPPTTYFARRTVGGSYLFPGDLISFNLSRRGLAITDLFNATVYTVALSLNYNVGHSEYPG